MNIFSEFSGVDHKVVLEVSPELVPKAEHWSNYPATVVRRLARNFGIKHACDLSIQCDLPGSSGMSSSSAMICAMYMVLSDRNNIPESDKFKEFLATEEELYRCVCMHGVHAFVCVEYFVCVLQDAGVGNSPLTENANRHPGTYRVIFFFCLCCLVCPLSIATLDSLRMDRTRPVCQGTKVLAHLGGRRITQPSCQVRFVSLRI